MRRCLLLFLVITGRVCAQAGLFLSAADLVHGHLTHGSTGGKVYPHELMHRNTISVRCNDSLFVYNKRDVYGYSTNGGVFRLVDGDVYEVLNPSEPILLYRQRRGAGIKNVAPVDRYFVSRNAAGRPVPLSLRTLLDLFSDEPGFILLLEIRCRDESELSSYDALHGMYTLNRLYQLSQILKQ